MLPLKEVACEVDFSTLALFKMQGRYLGNFRLLRKLLPPECTDEEAKAEFIKVGGFWGSLCRVVGFRGRRTYLAGIHSGSFPCKSRGFEG